MRPGSIAASNRPTKNQSDWTNCCANVRSATCLRYQLPAETVEVDSPEVTISSQLVQLEILFRNLIDNAVKYGGSPPARRGDRANTEADRTGRPFRSSTTGQEFRQISDEKSLVDSFAWETNWNAARPGTGSRLVPGTQRDQGDRRHRFASVIGGRRRRDRNGIPGHAERGCSARPANSG